MLDKAISAHPLTPHIIAVFYLTDLPSQAQWLPADERDWLVSELQAGLKPPNGISYWAGIKTPYISPAAISGIAACQRRLFGSCPNANH